MVINPNTKTAYVIFERQNVVAVYAIDQVSGMLVKKQEIATVPEQFLKLGPQFSSEIVLHPNRKWLYVSNVGIGSIIGYNVDPVTGTLTLNQVTLQA